jgi:hypothetical protein
MISKLKNWWFALLGMAAIILDQGFEVLNPFLIEIGLPEKWIGLVKLAFGLYAVYKLKKALPTQNPEKLQDLVQSIGGTQIPPKKDEK